MGAADADAASKVCRALFALAAAGQATVSALPLDTGRESEPCPCVWPLARLEAACSQPWVTSLRHDAVALGEVAAFLCPHLDGTRDRAWLQARLVDAVRQQRVRIPDVAPDAELAQDRLDALAAKLVERAIADLARDALLEPALPPPPE